MNLRVADRERADWLTMERAAYGGVALIAMGLRLWGLGWLPLGPAEAAQALPALVAVGGQAPDLAGVSPLLYSLQRGSFTLFGATDAMARFWPALFAGLSSLLFYGLRDRLTRGGALAAAFLWALSPLAVWGSRQGTGAALVPALALAVLAASNVALHGRAERTGAAAGCVGLALGLLIAAGSTAYTALLAGALALLWWPGLAGRLAGLVNLHRRAMLTGLLAALVLGASFFLTNLSGLASAIELLGRWLRGLAPGVGEVTLWEILRRVLLGEPLLLVLGGAGLIWAARWRERFGLWAGCAAGLALLIPLVGRGRQPSDLALAALGLTLLAGPALARILRGVWRSRAETDFWLLFAVSLALLCAAAICLPSAATPANQADWRSLYTVVGLVTALLAVVLWVVYGVFGSWPTVARVVPFVLLVGGLAWTLGQTVSLSFDRGAGRQAASERNLPASDTKDFRAALRAASALHGGGTREAAVDLVWPEAPNDPLLAVLRWQLRDFADVRVTGALPADPAPIVITAVEAQPRLSQGYSGAEFALLQSWQPAGLGDFNATLRWVLYREARTPPEKSKVILWVERAMQ